MSKIQSVKGTRDFYPEAMAFRSWLYARIREASESFGYKEWDAPYLERLELYAAKSGEELVKEQSFVFPDRNGEMLALRPELTPSLARMISARSKSLPKPVRWWSFGPFWRYERPQKGRTREFFQWNIDLLGSDTPQADAEIAAVAATFFRRTGLGSDAVRLLVNNRELVDARLAEIDVPAERRIEIYRLIDRREKLSTQAWEAQATELGLGPDRLKALRELLEDPEAYRRSEALLGFFAALEALGVREYFDYDPTIIRGLDYYTGTIFEARDASGEYRAILGGGRYNTLVSDVGGDPLPAVGFAMGDVVSELLMQAYGVRPDLKPNPADVLVPAFDEATLNDSLRLSAELRAQGLRVEWYPEPDRLGKQLKYADGQGIPVVAILGPDELSNGNVTLKDLRIGEQRTVARGEAAPSIKDLLRGEMTAAGSPAGEG